MGGRRDVEPDDVVQLLREGGSLDSLKARQRCGLRPWAFQISCTVETASPIALAIALRRPVRRLVRRGLERQPHDLGDTLGCDRRLAGRPRLVAQQAVDARLHEPRLPTPDARFRRGNCSHDRVRADAIGAEKNDAGPPDVLLGRVAVGDDGFKPLAIGVVEGDGYTVAHAPNSHAQPPMGIPIRTFSFRLIH